MTADAFQRLVLDLLADQRERPWVEFKRNNADLREIGEYLSALANAAALHEQPFGYIVWGIDDDTRRPVSTTFRPDAARQGNEELEPWLTRLLSPPVEFTVHEGEVDQARVVMFRVAAAHSAPVRFSGTEYIRVGTAKKPLVPHSDHERRLWDRLRGITFESCVVLADVPGAEVVRLLDDDTAGRLLERPPVADLPARLQRLADFRAVVPRGPDRYDIPNLGAVLLARRLADFGPRVARRGVRVAVYQGRGKLYTLRDLEFDTGYAVAAERVADFFRTALPQRQTVGRALREEVHSYPPDAVRELLVNAMVHQDFDMSGTGPTVEVYDDRMEFTNPGPPLLADIRRLIGHPPRSRNESLAWVARQFRMCEERGTGLIRAVSRIEQFHLPPPDFQKTDSHMQVTLFAPKPFGQLTREEKIRACFQHACLCYARKEALTNSSLRERFGLTDHPQASRVIKDALEQGWIKELPQLSKSTKDRKYLPFWVS